MANIPKVIEYLVQYSIETGTTLRSTSDLSPLEEWLLNKLHSSEQLNISGVIGSSIPKPPKPPLSRILREGVGHFCTNCASTVSKDGLLGLFGEMLCHNQECPNSKSKKNYR